MFPVLLTLGPFSLRTISIFLVLAFLVSGFVFWKRGRAEHYSEEQLFDGFLLSGIVGYLIGRIGFIVAHYSSASILQWLNPIAQPGVIDVLAVVAAGLYLYRFAKQNKWDEFEVLDLWSMSVAAGMAVISLGTFFSGSGIGFPTSLPWGVRFPGLIDPVHPVQLYSVVWYAALFWYLSWAEYRYRTFSWYRGSKKAAQTGYLISVCIIVSALGTLLFSFLQPASTTLFGINVDQIWSVVLLLAGMALLYTRSGRVIPLTREWLKQKRRLEKLKR